MTIGLIAGTGVYDPALFTDVKQERVHTPYGMPSDLVTIGKVAGKEVAFIPRHGTNHTLSPSRVNYRANIWALKQLGVRKVFSVSAVGSLQEDVRPGELVITDQIIDRTYMRQKSYYEEGKVGHISVAEPFCGYLREVLINAARQEKLKSHDKGTCVVIEGPRFSTIAESNVFRSWGAHIINMTMAPEAFLAREAEMSYGNIAMVTDYDVWRGSHVSNKEVVETMKKNLSNVKKLLARAIEMTDEKKDCPANHALENAFF